MVHTLPLETLHHSRFSINTRFPLAWEAQCDRILPRSSLFFAPAPCSLHFGCTCVPLLLDHPIQIGLCSSSNWSQLCFGLLVLLPVGSFIYSCAYLLSSSKLPEVWPIPCLSLLAWGSASAGIVSTHKPCSLQRQL